MENEDEKTDKPKGPPYSLKRVAIVFVLLFILAPLEFFSWYYTLACYSQWGDVLCNFCRTFLWFVPLILALMLIVTITSYVISKKFKDKQEVGMDLAIAFAAAFVIELLIYLFILALKWIFRTSL
ncbi:MAG: hypothetical protein ABIH76_05140 [Candidatus Bathyarchaeota archaeon]